MKKVLIQGPVATRSGYGAHTRDLALSLIKSGKFDVEIAPTAWGNTPLTALDAKTEDNAMLIQHFIKSPNLDKKPDIFLQVTIPNEFNPIGEYNIGVTAGIETDLAPGDWLEGCNRMDLVIATSQHSADVLKNTKLEKRDQKTNELLGAVSLEKPIEVLFEGVDTSIFHRLTKTGDIRPRVITAMNQVEEDFAFLVVGHWLQGDLGQDRKDIGMTIKTFYDAFQAKKKKPALVLKVSLGGFSIPETAEILNRIQLIAERTTNNPKALPNVYLISDDLTDEEMNSLYNHPKIKAMVSLTKGEGFGRPLLEFASLGKPVVASNWSGHLDFLDKEYHTLIPGELKQVHPTAANNWVLKDAQWFTPDYGFATLLYKDIYDNYDNYLDKSKNFIKQFKNSFTFIKMQERFVEILENLPTGAPTSIKLPKLKVL